jgi:hypothetical protein
MTKSNAAKTAKTAETKNLVIDVAALETTDQTPPAIVPEPRLDTNGIILRGMAEHIIGKNSALKALIWFAYGYHVASETDTATAVQYLADLKAKLIIKGDVRSDYEKKIKRSKIIGEKFYVLFGPEIVSTYQNDYARIEAMFNNVQLQGVSSMPRLLDLAQHGNADHTAIMAKQKADLKAQIKAETAKMAEAEKAKMAEEFEIELANLPAPANFDLTVYALEVETPAVAANTINKMFAPMLDSEIETLMAQCAEELAKRLAVAIETDARFEDVA